jgi:hypothetical protein
LSQIPEEILKEGQKNQKKGTAALLKYLRLEMPPEVIVSPSSLAADLKTLVNSSHFSDLKGTNKPNGAKTDRNSKLIFFFLFPFFF